MEIKKCQTNQHTILYLILAMFILNIAISSLHVKADEQSQLYIAIFDCENGEYLDDDIGYVLLEDKKYDIEIYYEDENESPIRVYDVTVDLPWASYFIASGEENSWITIETPSFEEYNEFTLIAYKEGYISAEEYIMISKGTLFVTTDRENVKEDDIFIVTIKDQYNSPVSGAVLYVEGLGSILETTNENGRAHLNAPEVDLDMEISITAIKGGYFPGSDTIYVENLKSTFLGEIESRILEATPILFSIFAVILAMIYAKIRKKTPIPISASNTTIKKVESNYIKNRFKLKPFKKSTTKQYDYSKRITNVKNENKKTSSSNGGHIEIIRIRGNEDVKEKKRNIIANELESKKIIIPSKDKGNDWFCGTDYVKYKIDKLTGEENNNPDNWFVGQDNSRFMVDQKLINKKQNKKDKKIN